MLTCSDYRLCWCYAPRTNKALLPFHSNHSKLVKGGITSMCFNNALKKSCTHFMSHSFMQQMWCLKEAGYSAHVWISVAEKHLKKIRAWSSESDPQEWATPNCGNTAVIPYIDKMSHKSKKVALRENVRVVFSVPHKLKSLALKTNSSRTEKTECGVKHKHKFIECKVFVIYRIPLFCGKCYVGQTSRCVNVWLREHDNKTEKLPPDGFLSFHTQSYGCRPKINRTIISGCHKDKITRLIVEAEGVDALGDICISKPSVSLSTEEFGFLRKCWQSVTVCLLLVMMLFYRWLPCAYLLLPPRDLCSLSRSWCI